MKEYYKSNGSMYLHIAYIQIYNHCVMRDNCLDCSFYKEDENACAIAEDDWDDIRDMRSFIYDKEMPVYLLLKGTDINGDDCNNNCEKCKYGMLAKNWSSSWSCAPFAATRNFCKEMFYNREINR